MTQDGQHTLAAGVGACVAALGPVCGALLEIALRPHHGCEEIVLSALVGGAIPLAISGLVLLSNSIARMEGSPKSMLGKTGRAALLLALGSIPGLGVALSLLLLIPAHGSSTAIPLLIPLLVGAGVPLLGLTIASYVIPELPIAGSGSTDWCLLAGIVTITVVSGHLVMAGFSTQSGYALRWIDQGFAE